MNIFIINENTFSFFPYNCLENISIWKPESDENELNQKEYAILQVNYRSSLNNEDMTTKMSDQVLFP